MRPDGTFLMKRTVCRVEGEETRDDICPFLNDIPQADLDVLLERLSRTCLPDEFPGVGLPYGLSLGYVKHLLEDWRTGYE